MSLELWITYTVACVFIILSPGPDNILAIGRGLSQGPGAAMASSFGASLGLLVHAVAATFGVAVIIQTSATAFTVVKVVGAAYLIWLGIKAISSRDLITFSPSETKTITVVLLTGFLTNVLNPKPVIFILAFVPQFIAPEQGSITAQSLLLGSWFAALTFFIFTVLGCFASTLAKGLSARPGLIFGLNVGAGIALVSAGLSVAMIDRG